MSSLLARLGRFSARHRWGVLITWLLVFSALIGVLLVGGKLSSSEAAPQEMPETAAGRALDRMNEEFPSEGSAHETLQLVFRPTGGDVTADAEAIGDLLAEAAELPGVDAVSNPLSPETPYVSPSTTGRSRRGISRRSTTRRSNCRRVPRRTSASSSAATSCRSAPRRPARVKASA
jgi:RND superfamily putative drug exporter